MDEGYITIDRAAVVEDCEEDRGCVATSVFLWVEIAVTAQEPRQASRDRDESSSSKE